MVMRWCVLWSLIRLMQAAPVRANPDLEARIVEIEQRNVQAPWPESAALIEALGPEVAQASPEQRARVELVRLRNLALAGDFSASTDGIAAFRSEARRVGKEGVSQCRSRWGQYN